MDNNVHQPVLAESTLSLLAPVEGQAYLDLTAGYGGHASLVLESLGDKGSAVLVDRDQNAISHLNQRFLGDERVKILHADYESASSKLVAEGKTFDCILADIGVSSPHLDNPDRGFSFMNEGPLDMRMDPSAPLTAAKLIENSDEEELANILFRYGEVRGNRSLARHIIEHRPYSSTTELAEIVKARTFGPQRMRVLAQVFQALRIAVNDELGQLERSLPLWVKLLKPGGRLAVITFHSLEDRIVKQYFAEHGGNRFDSEFEVLTKQPVVGTKNEIVFNPRARSAKLRVIAAKK